MIDKYNKGIKAAERAATKRFEDFFDRTMDIPLKGDSTFMQLIEDNMKVINKDRFKRDERIAVYTALYAASKEIA